MISKKKKKCKFFTGSLRLFGTIIGYYLPVFSLSVSLLIRVRFQLISSCYQYVEIRYDLHQVLLLPIRFTRKIEEFCQASSTKNSLFFFAFFWQKARTTFLARERIWTCGLFCGRFSIHPRMYISVTRITIPVAVTFVDPPSLFSAF